MSRPPCGARCSVPRPEPFLLLLASQGIGAVLLGEVRDGLLVLGWPHPDRCSRRRDHVVDRSVRWQSCGTRSRPWPTWCAMVFEPKSRLATSCPGMCCCWRRGTWCLPTFEYSPAGASSSIAASSLASRYQSRRARLPMPRGRPWQNGIQWLMPAPASSEAGVPALVVATGHATELGAIAEQLASASTAPIAAPARARSACPHSLDGRLSTLILITVGLEFVRGQPARCEPARRHQARRSRRSPRNRPSCWR